MERRKCHILLVEDNAADAKLFQLAAQEAGNGNLNLAVAADGAEALDYVFRRGEHAGSPPCELVVLDLNLPRVDGIDVLKAIKADAAMRVVPVIVLSTSGNPNDIRRSYLEGACAYMRKSPDAEQTFTMVRAFVNYWINLVRLPDTAEG